MKNKILTLFVIFGVLAFNSCKDDKELSTEEAKQEIAQVSQEMSAMINALQEGEAMNAINEFMQVAKKSVVKTEDEEWFDAMFEALDSQINFENLDSEISKQHRFVYSSYLGRYTWNFETQLWVKTAANSITLEFPASKTSTTNNAVISIESFTDMQVTIDGETAWLPTKVNVKVVKDGTKLMSIDLNEASYSNSFPYANKFDVTIFVAPVTEHFVFEKKSNRQIYASQTLSDNLSSLGVEGTLNLTKDFDENFDETYFNTLVGKVYFNDLTAKFNLNLASIVNYTEDPTEAQVNNDIKVDFYVRDEKFGYLSAENERFYVVYNNGDKEALEVAFADVITALEKAFDDNLIMKKMSLKKKLALRKKAQKFEKTIKFVKYLKK